MSTENVTQTIPFAGKSSFALDNARKRSMQYLNGIGKTSQIPRIPDRYPTRQGILAALDIAARAKILKAHLEDAFATNRFSVKITRKKSSPVLSITHDSLETELVKEIAKMYADSTIKLVLTRSQGIPLMIP